MMMSEIPDDVMKAAYDAALDYRHEKACDPIHNDDSLQLVIARAILAERERCAKVAMSVKARSDWYNGAYDGVQDVIDGINNS
jgi:hypothetical protein